MTFLKALVLCMTAQGIAGSILSAITTGIIIGQPFALLSGGLLDLAYRALTTSIASVFPSLVIVAALVVLAPRVPGARPLYWVFGAALWSGAVWAGLGLVLGMSLPTDPYLGRIASAHALAGVISGAAVGWYLSPTRQHLSTQHQSHK